MMENRLNLLARAFACLLVFPALLAGAYSQTEEFAFSATAVEKLVDVNFSQGFGQFVPGYAYSGEFSVKWAVAPDALKGIDAKSVRVFVKAAAKENDSGIFFRRGEMNAREYYFVLECKVSPGGACGENSSLGRAFSVYYQPEKGGKNASAGVVVSAELEPFIEEQNAYADFAVNADLRDALEAAQSKVRAELEKENAAQAGALKLPFIPQPGPSQRQTELEGAMGLLGKAKDREAEGHIADAEALAAEAEGIAEKKPQGIDASMVANSAASAVESAAGAVGNAAGNAGGTLTGFASAAASGVPFGLLALSLFAAGYFWKKRKTPKSKEREEEGWL
ncbi:MAG: hypothetical protein WC792_02260 [Candidatus Micrarchaeia archaeon]|jgi:hypothetical protein